MRRVISESPVAVTTKRFAIERFLSDERVEKTVPSGVQTCPLIPSPWIEGIAESVADQVEGQHREADHDAGGDRDMRVGLNVGPRRGEHGAPVRRRRLYTK